jgi:flagellar hook assembly protein FlgD
LYRVDLTLRAGPDVTEEDFQVNFVAQTVGTDELKLEDLTLKYGPNPFSNDLNLSYRLDDNYDMQINVIGVNGQVGTMDLGTQGQGEHNFKWSPNDNLSDGMYILQLVGTNSKGQQFKREIKTIYTGN